jgi:hypothetical protein
MQLSPSLHKLVYWCTSKGGTDLIKNGIYILMVLYIKLETMAAFIIITLQIQDKHYGKCAANRNVSLGSNSGRLNLEILSGELVHLMP